MRLLITGSTGFSGRYLVDDFFKNFNQEIEIFGLVNKFRIANNRNKCHYIEGDLLDSQRINSIIADISPDLIVHLAGVNRGTLNELFNVNVIGTDNLLNAVHKADITPRILMVGSSAEYGYQGDIAINETMPVRPLSPYGISKTASSMLAVLYRKKYQLEICIAKPFNLTGPGQTKDLFCGNLISKILSYEHGDIDRIELINPDSKRDYVDVRDVVRAYRQLICHSDFEDVCSGNIFNVGSGSSYSVLDTFNLIKRIRGVEYQYEAKNSISPDLVPSQLCDWSSLYKTIHWQPEIPFMDSLRDMIHYASNNY
jgi:nucleoside-diphosphate-sugar epimerase